MTEDLTRGCGSVQQGQQENYQLTVIAQPILLLQANPH